MDRRYSQSRFYDGTRASGSSSARREALVRSHLARARRANAAAQSYGGSTGGRSSALGAIGGAEAASARGAAADELRAISRTYGAGALGASQEGGRSSLARLRGFKGEPASSVSTPIDQPQLS